MFETTFTVASSTTLPPNLELSTAVEILHDFETVMKLSPDCHSTKSIPPPKGSKPQTNGTDPNAYKMSYYEVEDDLPFMPKTLWKGGVKYTADFLPTSDGCDITVHAPGGFTSTNHWRILRSSAPLKHTMHKPGEGDEHNEQLETLQEEELSAALGREAAGAKDLSHADTTSSGGWYVEIISDAKCPRTFVSIIKGFLKNSHAQLQHTYIDRLKATATVQPAARPKLPPKRPTLGRRRSSVL